MTHLYESDKTIEAWRMATKLKASYAAEKLQDECRALTHKLVELVMFLPTEPANLFRDIAHYRVMIV